MSRFKAFLRDWLGLNDYIDILSTKIQALEDRVRLLELPPSKEELTAGDIIKSKPEHKSTGRQPWRVMQREAELANSPEIQREIRTKKELKEIEHAQ